MARDRDHLALPSADVRVPRRPRPGGGRPPTRDSPRNHGASVDGQAETLAAELTTRSEIRPGGIDPRLVFRLRLHPSGNLDDAALAGLGLHVLAADGRHRIVVFPDGASLEALRSRARNYSATDGRENQAIAAIEAIEPIQPEDRVGPRLERNPLEAGTTEGLDVELWHTGDRNQMFDVVDDLRVALEGQGVITDQYVGRSLCVLRIRTGAAGLTTLLATDHIRQVDRRPTPSFEIGDLVRAEIGDFAFGPAPAIEAPGVVVVDSGISTGHPILAPVIADVQSFLGTAPTRSDDDDDNQAGHGTSVAGIAAYGDIAASVAGRRFDPSIWVFGAAVTIGGSRYDPDTLVETQLQDVVRYFVDNYPNARVISISLGDDSVVLEDGDLQFRLAAVIDELAFENRESNVVFVVATGNQRAAAGPDELVRDYPLYLGDDDSRLIDPATSALAITVGGLSYGDAAPLNLQLDGVERGIAERGWPSPFTRTGPGLGGMIKPDMVHFAGDSRFARGIPNPRPGISGLATTSHRFGPPEAQLFHTVAGTSFAAPRVAHIAARIQASIPGSSSNLVKALLADSCRVPPDRPAAFAGLAEHEPRIINTYGYGMPDLERATRSADSSVLLIADEEMPLDTVRIFAVPFLPPEFLVRRGRGTLSVSLSFDPPTRHTRSRDYLGVTMQFAMYRNMELDALVDSIRRWGREEREELEGAALPGIGDLGSRQIDMLPGPRMRNRSTLQHASKSIASPAWRYDGGPIYLAVICQRRWAPADITSQRFAVVASVEHEDETVDLYAPLRLRTAIHQRVRLQAT